MIEISIRSAHHRSAQITTGCRRAADWRWCCVVAGARRALHRAASAGGPGSGSAPAAPHIGQPERKLHTAIISAQPSPAQPSPLSGLIMSDGPMSMSTRHPRCTAQPLNVNQITVGGGMEWREMGDVGDM